MGCQPRVSVSTRRRKRAGRNPPLSPDPPVVPGPGGERRRRGNTESGRSPTSQLREAILGVQRGRGRRRNPRESPSLAPDHGGDVPVPPVREEEGNEVVPGREKDGNDHALARTDPGRGRTNPREVLSPLSHTVKEAGAGLALEENIPGVLAPRLTFNSHNNNNIYD